MRELAWMNSSIAVGMPAKNIALKFSTSTPCETAEVATIILSASWMSSVAGSNCFSAFRTIDSTAPAAANQVGADAFDDRAAPEVPMLSVRDARKRGQYLISALLVRDVGESDTMEVDSGCDDVETAGERSESAPTTGA
jgi:hypothetical protein